MNHNSRTVWVAALAAGSAVGAAAGLLFAPLSGRKLRRKIRHSAENAFHGISAKGDRLYRHCGKISDNVVHFVRRSA
jgi:gas vesicle protein